MKTMNNKMTKKTYLLTIESRKGTKQTRSTEKDSQIHREY